MNIPASSVGPVTPAVRSAGASLADPSAGGSHQGEPQDADWDAWLAAWEVHLDRMSDWLSSPEIDAPEPPTAPQPDGMPGEHLRVRLARADVAVSDLVARVETAVEARSRWARATESSVVTTRASRTIDL